MILNLGEMAINTDHVSHVVPIWGVGCRVHFIQGSTHILQGQDSEALLQAMNGLQGRPPALEDQGDDQSFEGLQGVPEAPWDAPPADAVPEAWTDPEGKVLTADEIEEAITTAVATLGMIIRGSVGQLVYQCHACKRPIEHRPVFAIDGDLGMWFHDKSCLARYARGLAAE